jgi:hypothetical protein
MKLKTYKADSSHLADGRDPPRLAQQLVIDIGELLAV